MYINIHMIHRQTYFIYSIIQSYLGAALFIFCKKNHLRATADAELRHFGLAPLSKYLENSGWDPICWDILLCMQLYVYINREKERDG